MLLLYVAIYAFVTVLQRNKTIIEKINSKANDAMQTYMLLPIWLFNMADAPKKTTKLNISRKESLL